MRGRALSQLRLGDLSGHRDEKAKLVNVYVSADTLHAIHQIAKATASTKTDTVIALLNEGLAAWAEKSKAWELPQRGGKRKRRGRPPLRPLPPAA